MFSRLKPVPRALLIAAIVGSIGYAVNTFIKLPATPPQPAADPAPPVTVVQTPTQPPATQQAAPAPAPEQPVAQQDMPSGLRAAGQSDAGLDAVLNAGKR